MLKLLSFFAVLCFTVSVSSAPISLEKAESIAKNATKSDKLSVKYKSFKKYEGKNIRSAEDSNPLFYIFQNDNDNGFVIVSGDDVFKPIIGVSENGNYDLLNMPPNFAWYIENIEREMEFALENGFTKPYDAENKRQQRSVPQDFSYTPGTYLIKTKWDQLKPYNNKTPIIDGAQTLTGCVATVMAQIMNYHKHPKYTTDVIPEYYTKTSNIYIPPVYPIAFDWDNMIDDYNSEYTAAQAEAIANLMSVAGRANNMDYTINGSGTNADMIKLTEFLGYNTTVKEIFRDEISNDEWENILRNQIDQGLPVYYSGDDYNKMVGHAFILDGYDDNNNFHINWGWGGNYDGFFSITAGNGLIAEDSDYSSNQSAIIDIKPRDFVIDRKWYYMNMSKNEFIINTAEELFGFASLVNGGESFENKIIKLGADIILNDTTNWQDWENTPPANLWTTIVNFGGTFDGSGFVVSGVYKSPLFSSINSTADIKNLGIISSYIQGNAYQYIGGLVGHNNGGEISNCYFTGNIFGEGVAGGLVGRNIKGTITDCYFTGNVSGGLFSNELIGHKDGGTISNCYYEVEKYDNSITYINEIPKIATEMKNKNTFTDWDFENTWDIDSEINNGYPFLQKSTKQNTVIVGVIFVNNGDKYGDIKLDRGKKIIEPKEPLRTGFTFIGWYLDVECKTAFDFENLIDDDIMLFAKWTSIVDNPSPINNIKKSNGKTLFKSTIVSDKMEIMLDEMHDVRFVVYDMTGNVVADGRGRTWDLRNSAGRFVANGSYLVVVEATDKSGAKFRWSEKLGIKR